MKNREYFQNTSTIDKLMQIAPYSCPKLIFGGSKSKDETLKCQSTQGFERDLRGCLNCLVTWLNEPRQ